MAEKSQRAERRKNKEIKKKMAKKQRNRKKITRIKKGGSKGREGQTRKNRNEV